MGIIDQRVRSYLKIPGIFAQFFNECFFGREHAVDPAGLRELDSVTEVFSEPEAAPEDAGAKSGRKKYKPGVVERWRDVSMAAESGLEYRIILGIEEQTDIHYYMPVRVMLLDAISYAEQCRKKAAEVAEQGIKVPPTQGVPKGTVIAPAVTAVLYLGENEWDGPKNLYDMFGTGADDQEWLRQYVVDYPMHLIDGRHLGDKELEQLTGDLRIFFTALRYNYDEKMIRGMVAKYPDTWYTLAIVNNDDRYREYALPGDTAGGAARGGIQVDATLDRIEKRGFDKGFGEGISGLIKVQKKQGQSYEDTEKLLQDVYDFGGEESRRYMEKYWV